MVKATYLFIRMVANTRTDPKRLQPVIFLWQNKKIEKGHNSIIFSRASKRALQPWLTNWLTNSLIHGFSKHFISSVSLDWHGQVHSHSIHSFDEIWSDFFISLSISIFLENHVIDIFRSWKITPQAKPRDQVYVVFCFFIRKFVKQV